MNQLCFSSIKNTRQRNFDPKSPASTTSMAVKWLHWNLTVGFHVQFFTSNAEWIHGKFLKLDFTKILAVSLQQTVELYSKHVPCAVVSHNSDVQRNLFTRVILIRSSSLFTLVKALSKRNWEWMYLRREIQNK